MQRFLFDDITISIKHINLTLAVTMALSGYIWLCEQTQWTILQAINRKYSGGGGVELNSRFGQIKFVPNFSFLYPQLCCMVFTCTFKDSKILLDTCQCVISCYCKMGRMFDQVCRMLESVHFFAYHFWGGAIESWSWQLGHIRNIFCGMLCKSESDKHNDAE